MGKASRWLRNLFLLPGRKSSRKAKDRGAADDADCQSVRSAPLPSVAPSGREKRRWSFRRPGAAASSGGAQAQAQGPLASSSSHCFSEAEVHVVVVTQEQEQEQDDQQQQVAAAVVPEAASSTVVVPVPALGRRSGAGAGGRDAEAAAVKIQAAFRSYLARKALCALRGMVKLQAMVRGQLVRRQANLTLRRMQALVHAQRRARAERLRLLEVEDGASSRHQATPRQPPCRRSPQHPRSLRKPPEATERGSEENDVKIVEVDDGAPRASARRNSCYHHYPYSTSTTTPSRTPAKAELLLCQQKVSPTPSSSVRTLSGRFDVDDASCTSASEPTPTLPVPSRRRACRADLPFFPSYMANTESSRAKARSQSAPRQRLSSASETTALAASPSPSCWEGPSSRGGSGEGSSARRRASLDPLDLPGGGAPSRRMERCASRARAGVSSVPGSECGSSSTVGAPWQRAAHGAWPLHG